MKKQYLISLLGLAAVSVPLGNSLLNINQSQSESTLISTTSNTKEVSKFVQIDEENSFVTVFDLHNESGGAEKVSKGDQLQAINFSASYNLIPENYKGGYINIYNNNPQDNYNENPKILTISVSDFITLDEVKDDEKIIEFEITSENDYYKQYSNLWTYKVIDHSYNQFTLTGTDIDGSDEIKLGTVNYNAITKPIDKDFYDTEGNPIYSSVAFIDINGSELDCEGQPNGQVLVHEKTNKAEIDYEVDLEKNMYGNDPWIREVTWMNEYKDENGNYVEESFAGEEATLTASEKGDDSDKLVTGTLKTQTLDPATTYGEQEKDFENRRTWIKVTLNDGTVIETQPLSPFKTAPRKPEVVEEDIIAYIDTENNILEVTGKITLNGSYINNIEIIDNNGNPLETNYRRSTGPNNYHEYSYDVWTNEYTGTAEKESLKDYSIKVEYETVSNDGESSESGTLTTNLESAEINPNGVPDLSRLTKKLRAGSITAIVLVSLITFGLIVWAIYLSIRKLKTNKA